MTVVGDNTAAAAETDVVDQEKQTSSVVKESADNETRKNLFDDVGSTSDVSDTAAVDAAEQQSALPGVSEGSDTRKVVLNKESYDKSDLVITREEKEAFIDSMISGDRFRHTYTLFNGRISVTLRSRTSEETHAMYAYIRYMLSNGHSNVAMVEGDMSFVPLVAQIEELNGVKFPEMKKPYMFEESVGEINDPGWYEDFKSWKSKPEGLTSALISLVQLFEYKYWTMVKEAANKNFWNSDTSIEG